MHTQATEQKQHRLAGGCESDPSFGGGGCPVITAFKVTDDTLSIARDQAGLLPLPTDEAGKGALNMASLVHAVLIVGYDDSKRVFKFKNSHGAAWGDKGFGCNKHFFNRVTRKADPCAMGSTMNGSNSWGCVFRNYNTCTMD